MTLLTPTWLLVTPERRMPRYALLFIPASLLVVGCAGQMKVEPVAADHPASPDAPEASCPPLSSTLRPDTQDAPRTRAEPGVQGMEHQEHLKSPAPEPRHHGQNSPPAQHGSEPRIDEEASPDPVNVAPATPDAEIVFACPMHPEVLQKTPGYCPRCGMTLIKRQEEPQ